MESSLNAKAIPFIPTFLTNNEIYHRELKKEQINEETISKKQKKFKQKKQPKNKQVNQNESSQQRHKQKHDHARNKKRNKKRNKIRNNIRYQKNHQYTQNENKKRHEIDFPPLHLSQQTTNMFTNKDKPSNKIYQNETNAMPSNDWSILSSQIFQQAVDLNDNASIHENDSDQSTTSKKLTKLTKLTKFTKLKTKTFDQNANIPHQQFTKTERPSIHNITNISSNKESVPLQNESSKSTALFKPKNISYKRDITRLRERWWNVIRQQTITKQQDSLLTISRKSSSSSLSSYSSSSSSSSSSSTSSSSSSPCHPLILNNHSIHKLNCNVKSSNIVKQSNDQTLHFHKYNQHKYRLHAAICDNHYSALQYMLTNTDKYQSSYFENPSIQSLSISKSQLSHLQFLHSKHVSPLQLSIYLDKPNILKLLLDSNIYSFQQNLNDHSVESSSMSLLIIAVQLAHDGCVKVLISHGIKINTKTKDTNDTIFHICCKYAQPTTFHLLWNAFGKGSTKKRTLLCSRNKQGQTPLHIACFTKNITMVQEVVTSCSVASTKAYHMEDNDGYTPLAIAIKADALDIVSFLLNWNTNHNQKKKTIFQNKQSTHCNVVNIALKNGSLEMLSLLMEWNQDVSFLSNVSSSSTSIFYDALVNAMKYTSNTTTRLEMIQILIENGANPFQISNPNKNDGNLISYNDIPFSPFCLAAQSGDISVLQVMMDTYNIKLMNDQKIRRNHIQLQRQPKSFFDRKDQIEKNIVDASIRDALVISLYHAWMDNQIQQQQHEIKDGFSNHLKSAMFLLRRNTLLDDARLIRLITSMSRYSKGIESFYPAGNALFKGHYLHFSPLLHKKEQHSLSSLNAMSFWSTELLNLNWCWNVDHKIEHVQCTWMRESFRKENNDVSLHNFQRDECYLIVENKPLLAHKSILSMKSQKLAAAIRFATLQNWDNIEESQQNGKTISIPLDMTSKMASFFIQHCYHGSISHGLSLDNTICCHELLELAYIAEEYLCPSLALEVEMRMLSSKPRGCYCWCCCDQIEHLPCNVTSSQMLDTHLDHFESIQYFNCHYCVKSPSTLIHANTVIDTLSLQQQQHESLVPSDNYSIHAYYSFSPNKKTLKENDTVTYNHEFIYTNPFMAVKAISMKTILQEFKFCLKSDRYLECLHDAIQHISEDENYDSRQQYEECFSLSILQTILEDILSFSLPHFSGDEKLHSSGLICHTN